MSKYDDNEKDDIYYELKEFLKDHPISELLVILSDLMESKGN